MDGFELEMKLDDINDQIRDIELTINDNHEQIFETLCAILGELRGLRQDLKDRA